MLMKRIGIKFISLFMCAALAVSFSGCIRNIDVSRLVEEPIAFEAPEVEESVDKIFPPEVEDQYVGAYMDVYPVFGDSVRIKGRELIAQEIIKAYNDPQKIIDEEPSKRGYKNKIKIYNRQDQFLAEFEISSDFLLYARSDKNSPLFLLPEYAYYTLEYTLWLANASLAPPMEEWERITPLGDERATYAQKPLELRLAHDIKTLLVQKYGYSEAYFTNYNIYTTAEYSSRDLLEVRVYALLGYAGYSMAEEELTPEEKEKYEEEGKEPETVFAAKFRNETAVRIIYTFVDSQYYRLTDYKEPAEEDKDHPSSLESRIRAIFPYEYMKDMMAALDDVTPIKLEIHRQALDYLRISGQGKVKIDD